MNYTHYSKRALIVEIEERDQKIKILELKVKFLQDRVIGKSAKSLPPPAPIATTNMEFWGLETKEILTTEHAKLIEDAFFIEEKLSIKPNPPIKCTNCEE